MPKGKPVKRIYADISAKDMEFLKSEAKIYGLSVAEATGKAIRAWIKARRTVRNIEEGRGADGPGTDK